MKTVWAQGDDVWAAGAGGVVLRRHGGVWRYVGSDTLGSLVSIWGGAPSELWVVAEDGLIGHLKDGAWTTVTEIRDQVNSAADDGTPGFHSIWVSPGGRVWAVGGVRDDVPLGKQDESGDRSHISFAAFFDGQRWELVRDEDGYPFDSVWGRSEREVWACVQHASCARWNGKKFRAVKNDPPVDIWRARHGMGAASPPWAIGGPREGDLGRIRRGDRPPGDPVNQSGTYVKDLFVISDDDVWGVGDLGAIVHWNGSAWAGTAARAADAVHVEILDIWAAGGGAGEEVWAVGKRDMLSGALALHRQRGAWTLLKGTPLETPQPSGGWTTIWSVTGRTANDVWMAGDGGSVMRWNGRALSVVAKAGRNKPRIRSVHQTASGEAFLAAGAAILHGGPDGKWAKLDLPDDRSAEMVAAVAPDDVWVFAPRTGNTPAGLSARATMSVLLHWDGTAWKEPFTDAVEHEALGVWRDVRTMEVSPGRAIWFATKERVARITADGQLEAIAPPADPPPRDWAWGLWIAGEDEIWVTGDAGFWRWNAKTWHREETPGAPWARTIHGGDDFIWAAGPGTILRRSRTAPR